MPTFDFRCKKCGKTFEGTIPFGSKRYPACTACKSKSVDKLLAKPLGIMFKGEGFYKTDSSSPSSETPKPEKSAEKPVKEANPSTSKES